MFECQRQGCSKNAVGDEYCSADCCRIDHGLQSPLTEHELKVQRRRTETMKTRNMSRSIRGLRPKKV